MDARHHRAHAGGPADTRIVFVPIPVGGSPEAIRQAKPPKYPNQRREAWPPRQGIPHRVSKAEALRRFLDDVAKNGEAARAYMQQARGEARHHAN